MRCAPGFLALSLLVLVSCRPDSPTLSAPQSDSPALVSVAGAFSSISAGIDNSCVLDAGGKAYCMGYSGRGAVGYGGFSTFIIVPYPVTGGLSFTQVSAGATHVCAVATTGTAYCWGNNENGELGTPTSPCGYYGPCSPVPVAVGGGLTLRRVEAGNQFSCGLDLTGRAFCWGDNTFGQLGDGTTISRIAPAAVAGGLTFVTLRAGGFHACGITGAGVLYCWGLNSSGQLGRTGPNSCTYFQPYNCATSPIAIGGTLRFSTLDAGSIHTCAIDTGNKAFCWGNNSWGQLGIPKAGDQLVPAPVNTARTFVSISTGYKETCAIDPAAQGFCWGATAGPIVTLIPNFLWSSLSPNDDHRCGITTGGGAFCWGHEDYGEMGEGGTHQDTRLAPTALAPLHLVDQPPVARVFITGCINLACTFDGTLSSDDYGIVGFSWTFGDGTTGTGSIVNHTYPASGTYLVTLTVRDSAGQTSSASTSADVYYNPPANQAPVAKFTYSCSLATMKCTFNASGSTDDQGIVGYLWHASIATKPDKTGVTMTRNFTRGQTWYETLTVTDAQGLTGKVTRKVVTP